MFPKMGRGVAPTNKSCEDLKLSCLAAEIIGRLRNPFVIHRSVMPGKRRGGAPQCYVSLGDGWKAGSAEVRVQIGE